MQTIRDEEIEELLTIIPRGYPQQDIFHLTSNCFGLCEALDKLSKAENYHYDLMIADESYYLALKENSNLKVQAFDFKKSRYNRQARQYDFVFVQIDLESLENVELFYKKLYAISKNGSKVLFIVDKSYDLLHFEETLIAQNYVAVNAIENTFENYHIMSAQKMHGWGN